MDLPLNLLHTHRIVQIKFPLEDNFLNKLRHISNHPTLDSPTHNQSQKLALHLKKRSIRIKK